MRRKKEYFEQFPGEPAPLSVTVSHRVRFSEVDAMAIVWHGRYLEFFEKAHTELMRRAGLEYPAYRERNLAAPVVQSHVDYFRPLRLDEVIAIEARLFWCEGARLNVAYRITGADGATAASGFTVQMFVDGATRAPCMVEPDLIAEVKERWRKGLL